MYATINIGWHGLQKIPTKLWSILGLLTFTVSVKIEFNAINRAVWNHVMHLPTQLVRFTVSTKLCFFPAVGYR